MILNKPMGIPWLQRFKTLYIPSVLFYNHEFIDHLWAELRFYFTERYAMNNLYRF